MCDIPAHMSLINASEPEKRREMMAQSLELVPNNLGHMVNGGGNRSVEQLMEAAPTNLLDLVLLYCWVYLVRVRLALQMKKSGKRINAHLLDLSASRCIPLFPGVAQSSLLQQNNPEYLVNLG